MSFEKVIEMIFASHADFKNEVKGASNAEIESLCRYTMVPDPYIAYLKVMGKETGRVRGVRKQTVNRGDGTSYIHESEILIDYHSVLKHYRKYKDEITSGPPRLFKAIDGIPADFFLFGIDTLGNDNGHFYLDLRGKDLPVVELTETLGLIKRSPSFVQFLFEDHFRREVSTFIHNKEYY